jgi:hypothetical protein
MAADLTTLNPILKDDYKDFVEQMNDDCFVVSQVEKNSSNVQGRRAVHSLHTRRSSGVGSRGDATNATLPTAANQGTAVVTVPLRNHYGRIKITLATMEQANAPTGAFVDGIDLEMNGIRNDVMRDRCRQVWGTSNGVIATCGTTTTSATIVLATTTTLTQMEQLWNDGGMVVDIGTVAAPTTVASARSVTAYSDATPGSYTITISGATVSTTGSHFIFRSGNGGATSATGLPDDGQYELTGLQTMVDAADTVHQLTVAAQPIWASYEAAVSGLPTEAVINNAIQKVARRSGETVDALICGDGVHQSIANLLLSTKRHVAPNVELAAGYSGIEWTAPAVGRGAMTKVALVIDRDCPGGMLFGLNFGSFIWYQTSSGDWKWLDQDGAVLSRVANEAAFEGTLFSIAEFAVKRRNTNFKLTGITETTS